MTLSITAHSIMTCCITTYSIITLCLMTQSINSSTTNLRLDSQILFSIAKFSSCYDGNWMVQLWVSYVKLWWILVYTKEAVSWLAIIRFLPPWLRICCTCIHSFSNSLWYIKNASSVFPVVEIKYNHHYMIMNLDLVINITSKLTFSTLSLIKHLMLPLNYKHLFYLS